MSKTLSINTVVTKIEEKNKLYKDKFKTCFYCYSPSGKDRLCVYWQRTSLEEGDRVIMQGYILKPSEIFLCTTISVIKKVKDGS